MNAAMIEKSSRYEELVKAAEDCLGPSAPQFVGRLIQSHLNKQPGDLSQSDITELADWMQIAVSLVTDSPKATSEFMEVLAEMSKQ